VDVKRLIRNRAIEQLAPDWVGIAFQEEHEFLLPFVFNHFTIYSVNKWFPIGMTLLRKCSVGGEPLAGNNRLQRKIEPPNGSHMPLSMCPTEEISAKHGPGGELFAMKVLVGIPAFDEERTIAKVVVRAQRHADQVLVVDDGSKDDTALIAERLGAVVLKHDKNLGKGAAIRDCLQYAMRSGADVLVTIDGDGQHDASEIPMLVDTLTSGRADVSIGSRSAKPTGMPRYRWLGGRALDYAAGIKVGGQVIDSQSGFRAYSRRAIESLTAAEFGMSVDSELIKKADAAGMRIVQVPISVSYSGKTSTRNPFLHWLEVLFGIVKYVSIRHPLLYYGGFSIISLIVAFVFGFMTLDYYQRWGRVITNLALVSVAAGILGFLALFTGIILFTLITVVRESSSR
jgi:glycosyltransferase involved in cell wall biosynthesis